MFKRNIGPSAKALLITIAFCGIASGGSDQNDKIQQAGAKSKCFDNGAERFLPKEVLQEYEKHKNDPTYEGDCYSPEMFIPEMLHGQYHALGERVKTKGKEKTVYEGKFFDAAGKSWDARVTVQLPGLVTLKGFNDPKSVLSFNKEQASKSYSRSDEALLEMFLMDMPEAILGWGHRISALNLIGRDFGPDPQKEPNYTGPRYDIYELNMLIPYKMTKSINTTNFSFDSKTGIMKGSTPKELVRRKKFYFDSKTRLLHKTQYYDWNVSPAVKVETQFSVWGTIDGSAYPAKMERYEDGKLIFTFIATKIDGSPAVDASNFK
jgi:hypothetical protein